MPRYIPIALKDHLASDATTTCYLLRIQSTTQGYPPYGVTSLDRNVVYDDGNGSIEYVAAVGAEPTALQANGDLSVDNAEATSLMPEFDVPISEEDIRAGVYDFASFSLMLVNYTDLTQGHVLLRQGTLGRISINDDGLSIVQELRGKSATLKQSMCEKDSLSCRAPFGSQPFGSLIPGPQVRYPCGYDATSLLQDATVLSVGLENTLTFSIAPDTSMEDNSLNPGMVFWVTGLNAGRSNEIDTNTDGGQITLAHETGFPIQVGDQLQYREDCTKIARDEAKGCKHWFGSDWTLHFRGEPDIPIGDAGALEMPGASGQPGLTGQAYVAFADDD